MLIRLILAESFHFNKKKSFEHKKRQKGRKVRLRLLYLHNNDNFSLSPEFLSNTKMNGSQSLHNKQNLHVERQCEYDESDDVYLAQ